LGLVARIVSDFLDNSKNSGASFVFDSITDLIRGERWEQVYEGIRQLIDLLTVPNATALFLANTNTMEPRFVGALRGLFAVQIRIDNYGLRAIKASTHQVAQQVILISRSERGSFTLRLFKVQSNGLTEQAQTGLSPAWIITV